MPTLDECADSTDCPPGQLCSLFVDSGGRCVDDTEAPTEVPAEGASDATTAGGDVTDPTTATDGPAESYLIEDRG